MILTGLVRLGRDALLRYTGNGDPVLEMALAFNYGQKDSGGNKPTLGKREANATPLEFRDELLRLALMAHNAAGKAPAR